MNAETAVHQRIGRLTPLADVLAAIGQVEPVAPREHASADALGCVLAADVVATGALPPAPVALCDGWAVHSEATRDAGPYAPLALQPPPQRVDTFSVLPAECDAVAPLDAVTALGGMMQIMAPVAPGEGVLPVAGDATPAAILMRAGSRLRASDVALLAAAGVKTVSIRQPAIRIVNTKDGDTILDAAASMIARAAEAVGARIEVGSDLERAFQDDADAIVGIGGTGSGRNDRSVIALAHSGSVTCHGIGLSPGETAAFGTANGRPVLLMPGRIDATLACWLVLGRKLMDRLTGVLDDDLPIRAMLSRKVASSVGLAEVVPLARTGAMVEPLASGYLSLQALARADGWLFVPAGSEGYPAGTEIEMRSLP